MNSTEQKVLNVIEKGTIGKTQLQRILGFSPEYTGLILNSLIRQGLVHEEKRYYSLAGNPIIIEKPKIEIKPPLNFTMDKETLTEMARGVAKEVAQRLNFLSVMEEKYKQGKERADRAERAKRAGRGAEIKIKTSFIPPAGIEEVKMENKIGKVKEEKEKFDISKAVSGLVRKSHAMAWLHKEVKS